MKRLFILIAGLGLVTVLQTSAQGLKDSGGDRLPPHREDTKQGQEPLTAAQVEQIKTILSKYDASTLTVEQAKAIHEAFRQAGVHGGPVLNDAVKAAGFDPDKLRDLDPPPGQDNREGDRLQGAEDKRGLGESDRPETREPGTREQGEYSLEQAVSDRAQLSTIAFSGLAFLAGDFGAATFLPPGKVCDYFGFQYMRDIDAAGKGHNPTFLNRVAGNVLHILNDQQRQMFVDLATEQAGQFEQLALKRMPLIKAFHRELNGDIPADSTGLSRAAVTRYVGDLFAYDAELSYRRAEVFGRVAASLTADQKEYLGKMKFGDFNTWPDLDERGQLKPAGTGGSRFFNVAYMTYASEFFSWYAGSVAADTYFCPERHATYFGGFYMKDMPAMNKRDFDISTSRTGDSGEGFLNALTAAQRTNITSIIDNERSALREMIDVRRSISEELRKFLQGGQADLAKVRALGHRYGELDGDYSWACAMGFASVNRTLTADQRTALKKLRDLDGYTSAPAYLYSQPLAKLPDLPDTDFLFGPAAASSAATVETPSPANVKSKFVLQSSAVTDGGQLPKEFTGDGASATLPLQWIGAPAGTKDYALIMHHIDPEGKTKWYWILYNIPGDTAGLPRNAKEAGILGNNSVNGRMEYAPPHSKGPGPKTYLYTVYALSAPVALDVPPAEVDRDVLLAAMKDKILATAELKVIYSRPDAASAPSPSASMARFN